MANPWRVVATGGGAMTRKCCLKGASLKGLGRKGVIRINRTRGSKAESIDVLSARQRMRKL